MKKQKDNDLLFWVRPLFICMGLIFLITAGYYLWIDWNNLGSIEDIEALAVTYDFYSIKHFALFSGNSLPVIFSSAEGSRWTVQVGQPVRIYCYNESYTEIMNDNGEIKVGILPNYSFNATRTTQENICAENRPDLCVSTYRTKFEILC